MSMQKLIATPVILFLFSVLIVATTPSAQAAISDCGIKPHAISDARCVHEN